MDLNHIELLVDEPLDEQVHEDFRGGPAVLMTAAGLARDDTAWVHTGWSTIGGQPPTTGRRVTLTAIPYHLWANRGPSVMRTFVPARRAIA